MQLPKVRLSLVGARLTVRKERELAPRALAVCNRAEALVSVSTSFSPPPIEGWEGEEPAVR